jgi:DNA-binding response OmpR family regulator
MARHSSNGKPKLLCVDDDPAIRDLYKLLFSGYGYDVVVAADGRQALNLFHPQKIDAVVSDYEMPGMSGGELAASIKRRSCRIPVILVSGCQSVVDTIPRMVDAAFPKGAPVAELVDRIKVLLASQKSVSQGLSRFIPLGSVLASVALGAFLIPKLWK